ncbi:hypothetical protein [Reichenbachiella sp.]|uniref:hypothetical protein n=1 Tax=Reichenbachiella sp. TaxID=2184521 RepID=UPI003BB0A2C6
MGFNQQQKRKLKEVVNGQHTYFDQLESQINELKNQAKFLKGRIDENSKNLGWKEKLFGGSLGGNKELAELVKSTENELQKVESTLEKLGKELKEKPDIIKKELTNALKEIDSYFKKLTDDRTLHYDLYKASKKYEELLKKAHQGVIDALLFLSWEKLINHPEASEKLNGFKNETLKYQKIVDKLRDNSSTQPIPAANLIDLIKFDSQEVAMSSFKKLLSQTSKYKKYTDSFLIQSKKEIQEYRRKAYEEVTDQHLD